MTAKKPKLRKYRVPGSATMDAWCVVMAENAEDALRRTEAGEGEIEVGPMHKRSYEVCDQGDDDELIELINEESGYTT